MGIHGPQLVKLLLVWLSSTCHLGFRLCQNASSIEEPGNLNLTANGSVPIHAAFVPNISAFQAVVPSAASVDLVVPEVIRVKAGIVLTSGTSNAFDYDLLAPALDVAFARALQVYNVFFDVHEFLYEVSSSSTISPDAKLGRTQGCWMWNATGKAAIAFNTSMDIIIGPACTDDMRAANELLTYFAVPCVTGGGNLVDSTADYPFLTRCSYNTLDIWVFLLDFVKRHAWTNIVLIFDNDSNDIATEAQSLMTLLKDKSMTVYDTQINATLFENFDAIPTILQDGARNGRVFIVLLHGQLLRYVLTTAYRIGMGNGEYVFITLDLFHEQILGSLANWQQRDGYDQEAKQAYAHLLVLSLKNTSSSATHQQFVKDVHSAVDAKRRYNDPVPATYPTVNYYMGAFHDVVVMLGRAIRQSIDEGVEMWPRNYNYRSGKVTEASRNLATNISHHLRNVSFQGVSGQVFLDAEGDRVQDMTIYYMLDTTSASFSPVAEFSGELGQYRQLVRIPWRTSNGQVPPNEPPCGYNNDKCADLVTVPTVITILVALLILAGLIAAIIFWRKARREARLANSGWVIEWEDIQLDKRWQGGSRLSMQSSYSLDSSRRTLSVPSMQDSAGVTLEARTTRKGRHGQPPPSSEQLLFGSWKGIPIMLRLCEKEREIDEYSHVVIEEMRLVRGLINDNLLKVYGAVLEPAHFSVVNEYCSKGTLQDVLLGGTIKLEWLFRFSLINDMVGGISYLHTTVLTYHGRLSSACCYVNGKFVLKIGDYGLPSFYAKSKPPADREPTNEELKAQYYTAPELLQYPGQKGSQEADVYAFAIILQEIVLREEAYSMYSFDPKEILWRVRKTNDFRPKIDAKEHPECPEGLLALMEQCWAKSPLERPRFPQIKVSLRQVTKGDVDKSNIVDLLIQRMETYATDLEGVAQEKTRAFLEEKKKADELLNQILPPMVAEKLKKGQVIPPEVFKSTTIFFSDIVGFAALSMESSPMEIVDFLNDLYSLFDATIPKFDVYKVETIHDSYMVASGLPTRNGLNHAKEQGNLALTLMELISTFKIRHRPGEIAQLRIGMNSGSVVASVIGLAVPRYCLFGDTVNTASRMESTGEGLKIQVSPTTKQLLDSFGTFHLEERGMIAVKGKGQIRTYWLLSGDMGKEDAFA